MNAGCLLRSQRWCHVRPFDPCVYSPLRAKRENMSVHSVRSNEELCQFLKSSTKLVVVDFFATWCGPCKAIRPKVHELAAKYGNVHFVVVDVDAMDVSEWGVKAMPTFQFFKGGRKVSQFEGANVSRLEETIRGYA